MKKGQVSIRAITPEDYNTGYNCRMERSELEYTMGVPLTLRVHTPQEINQPQPYAAFSLCVAVSSFERYCAELRYVMLDADFQPATREHTAYMNTRHEWQDPNLCIQHKNGQLPTPEGYLMRYSPDEADTFFRQMASLEV